MERVGRIHGYEGGRVYIVLHSDVEANIGDIYYTRSGDEYMLLQVTSLTGSLPEGSKPLLAGHGEPTLYTMLSNPTAVAEPLFHVKRRNGNTYVVRPTRPPSLGADVYRLDPGDDESRSIMAELSRGISPGGERSTPIGVLRGGTAQAEAEKGEKYFYDAPITLSLEDAVRKHILVAGQTGAGKTSSVMGILVRWGKTASDRMSWLVIDRHGEYSDPGGFLARLTAAISSNENLGGYRVSVYRVSPQAPRPPESVGGAWVEEGGIDASSLTVDDVAAALEYSMDRAAELETAVSLLAQLISASGLDESWKKLFVEDDGTPKGNSIALLPLVVDNMCNHEGVGEPSSKRSGLYSIYVRMGLDIRRLRIFRKSLASSMGFRLRSLGTGTGISRRIITVLDDSGSIFKVSPLLKNPYTLARIFRGILDSAVKAYNATPGKSYPWRGLEAEEPEEAPGILRGGISLDEIVERLERGEAVILDLSRAPLRQGDIVSLAIVRRVFENRVGRSFEEIRSSATIGVVSEEAPLYLSSERVRSPYNPFARIAREGRKFGIGLIAVTQLATMIEDQVLANFNTIISLRTKYRGDLSYLQSIGVPTETLPYLGDREGYLYTPDLRVKEPIPVYIPAWFEEEAGEKRSLEDLLEEV